MSAAGAAWGRDGPYFQRPVLNACLRPASPRSLPPLHVPTIDENVVTPAGPCPMQAMGLSSGELRMMWELEE